MGKIVSQKEISLISEREHKKARCVVFTNGCFDIIHRGHIEVLKQAKAEGDILIVGLNSDSSIREIKGEGRPILDEYSRALLLFSLIYVDYVIIFNEKTPYKLIKAIEPDILVKGGDWREEDIVGRDIVKKVVRIKPVAGYSTTEIIERMSQVQ